MIVKRMEDKNNIDFRAPGFPSELTDNEQEERGYEI
jgi:3-hydroxyisobutyrate dehydrogenase